MQIDLKDLFYTLAILALGLLELRSKNVTSDAAMVKATADALAPLRAELMQVRNDLGKTQNDLVAAQAQIDSMRHTIADQQRQIGALQDENAVLRRDNATMREELDSKKKIGVDDVEIP